MKVKTINLTTPKGEPVKIVANKIAAVVSVKDAYNGNCVIHLVGGEQIRVLEGANDVLELMAETETFKKSSIN